MSLYGLIIGIAFVLCSEILFRQTNIIKHKNIFLFGLLISSIIGARLYHVIEQWSYYSNNFSQIPNTRGGGLSILGAILAGLLFTFLYSKFNKINFLNLLDKITLVLPLGQGIGRFGNYVNHENPIWWPEAIMDFTLFFILMKFPKNTTAKYLIGYGLIRFVTEFWRSDTWVINSLKIGQIISFLFVITGLFLFWINYSKKQD